MPDLPARIGPVRPSREEHQAIVARRRTELALHNHELGAFFDRECARADAEAVFEASKHALEGELELLAWGMERARGAGSQAAAKLVADRVGQLGATNSAALRRRFQ